MQQLERIPLTIEETQSALLNGHSTEDRWAGLCRDCEDWDDNLMPYKYEPNTFLCEGCIEERMSDA